MADKTLRKPTTLEEVTVDESAVPFFVNQGYEVLDSAGRKSPHQPTTSEKKD